MKLNRLFIILILIIIISPKPIVNAVESDLEINLYLQNSHNEKEINFDDKEYKLFKENYEPFDKEEVAKQFPTDYNESLNTVLLQEVIRYNVLLNTMKTSIVTLGKGLTGKIVMDEEAEEMSHSLFINLVPKIWSGVFLSLKPLSSWLIDLNQRIKF